MNSTEQITFDISKIKLIVGIGNIGREYIGTRHNIGFEFVETLAESDRFLEEKKLKALVHEWEQNGQKIILAKPTTFMNSSGETVQLIKNFYKIEDSEILIVHDDLDIVIGSFKMQFGKGPKIHNGILSIENRLGTYKFWRLRIGVENRPIDTRRLIAGQDYVLGRFKADEVLNLSETFEKIIKQYFTVQSNEE